MNSRGCVYFVVVALAAGAGCQHSELYCEDHSDCSGERPFCDINGETESSEGIRKTCVAAPTRQLEVVLDGIGGGVVSTPAGIDCGTTCAGEFRWGTEVTLAANPDPGATFDGWSGACSGKGQCRFTVEEDTSVTASFSASGFPLLNVSFQGTGGGRITSDIGDIDCPGTCSDSYAVGTTVTLQSVADATSVFVGWSGACSGAGNCVVTLNSAQSVTATFDAVATYPLNITKTGTGDGTVTSHPVGIDCGVNCSADYPSGTVVTLSQTPNTNSTFAGWSGGGCSGTGPSCVTTVSGAQTVTAQFDEITYGLSVNKSGAGEGTITSQPAGIDCGTTCSVDFGAETVVTLTASPSQFSIFEGWSGGCSGKGTCTVTVSSFTSVSASFGRSPGVVFTRGTLDRLELYRAGFDGADLTLLSGSMIPEGGVYDGELSLARGPAVSPDNRYVAYVADQDTDEMFELYTARLDGTGVVEKVSGAMVPGGNVFRFEWSPDGSRISYLADQDTNDVFELYTVLPDGSDREKLSFSLASGGYIVDYEWAPDSSRVVFAATQRAQGALELHTVFPDGSGRTRVSGDMVAGGEVELGLTFQTRSFSWAPDSSRIAYVADQETDEVRELYTVDPDGRDIYKVSGTVVGTSTTIRGVSTLHTGSPPAWAPDGSRIVYVADLAASGQYKLYTTTPTSSGANVEVSALAQGEIAELPKWAPDSSRILYSVVSANTSRIYTVGPTGGGNVRVSGQLVSGGSAGSPAWSPDSTRIAYIADQHTDEVFELYTVESTGLSNVRVSSTMVNGGDAISFTWAPDSSYLSYIADQHSDGVNELYVVAKDGLGGNTKVSGSMVAGGNVTQSLWTPDGSLLLYIANQNVDTIFELFSTDSTGSTNVKVVSGVLSQGESVLSPITFSD